MRVRGGVGSAPYSRVEGQFVQRHTRRHTRRLGAGRGHDLLGHLLGGGGGGLGDAYGASAERAGLSRLDTAPRVHDLLDGVAASLLALQLVGDLLTASGVERGQDVLDVARQHIDHRRGAGRELVERIAIDRLASAAPQFGDHGLARGVGSRSDGRLGRVELLRDFGQVAEQLQTARLALELAFGRLEHGRALRGQHWRGDR